MVVMFLPQDGAQLVLNRKSASSGLGTTCQIIPRGEIIRPLEAHRGRSAADLRRTNPEELAGIGAGDRERLGGKARGHWNPLSLIRKIST